jgi:hypothetical protein
MDISDRDDNKEFRVKECILIPIPVWRKIPDSASPVKGYLFFSVRILMWVGGRFGSISIL